MLGKDGTVTKNRVAPMRSACAVLVGSQNQYREWNYYSSRRFRPKATAARRSAHSCRIRCARRKRRCAPIAIVSADGNNNAWVANVLMQGTNFVNFMGHNVWVADGKGGIEAVRDRT